MPPLAEADQLEVVRTCAHFNLKRAARRVTQLFDAALAPSGLRITQFNLLVASSRRGPAPLSDLAEVLALDRTTLSRNVGPLERRGLLRSVRGADDARVRFLQITAKGEAAVARALPLWRQAQQEVTAGLDREAYGSLLEQLEQLGSAAA